MKNSKFIPLYETIYNRYKQGAGFLEGDMVKLKSDYKSSEEYKSLSGSIKAHLEGAEKSGYNLRLGRLHTPDAQYGSMGYVNLPATHADMYQEKSPGNFGGLVTVPLGLIEVIDTGINLAPVSQNNKRPSDQYQKPGKWKSNPNTKETEDQNELGHEQNWVKKGDYELATKYKKPAVGANSYDDSKPSTKYKPLPKNKLKPKTLKESEQALNDIYIHILREDDNDTTRVEENNPHIKEKDDIYGFEKMALAGAKPGMSQKEVLSLAFTNIEKWAMATRKADASKAKIIAGNLLYYMNDGDGASDVVTYYSHVFPKTAANVEDEGNKFTGDLAHTKKGDEFKIGGKKVTNTTGTIAEEICPICKRDVCQCNEMEMVGNDMEAPCPKCHTNPCTCLEEESMFDESDLKHHIKDECWNMEEDRLVDECWAEDGSVKEECWAGTSNSEPAPASAVTGQENPTGREDGPMEEAKRVKRAYLPGGHPEDGVTIKAHPNSYLS